MSSQSSPLAGLRVLDFTHVFAGPFCTRTLADLGADVTHVENASRDTGDQRRAVYAHRNKRSISLDLKSAAGHAVAVRLANTADVIAENFSSEVMHRLGLDYDALCVANPGLIYISLSGYGHTGPRSAWTSMNMNLQAYTGLMMTTGAEGDLPTSISNSWNDYIGGLHGVIAVLQALSDRAETGRGRHIDLSQFECSVATLGALLVASAELQTPPRRMGNRSHHDAPQGVYPCAGEDQWIAISVETTDQWLALAETIGRADLARDPRFAESVGRMRHHDELDAAIAAWARGSAKEDAERALQRAGVSAERMRRVDDLVNSPDSGGAYRPIRLADGKTALVATTPFSLSESAVQSPGEPAQLGAHTHDVLRDWLALDPTEIAALEREHAFA